MNLQMKGPPSTALVINGMTCEGCARTVERVLSRVHGVESAAVDFGHGVATVKGAAAPSALVSAVEAAGYGASLTETGAAGDNNNERRSSYR